MPVDQWLATYSLKGLQKALSLCLASPDQVSDVPIGFRGQGAHDFNAVSSHDGDFILGEKKR